MPPTSLPSWFPPTTRSAPPDKEAPIGDSTFPPGLESEIRVGEHPEARAVNDMLLALSRAARAFTIYEPHNETVRRLIGRYRDTTLAASELCGVISLEVHPFELRYSSSVVYSERERERSLAFRLFRDGVRRIVIEREVAWEELLRFLEVFSIRYVGVRQQEDDMVTLLRKAQLRKIFVDAVEGFVPDEEDPEGPTKRGEVPEDHALPAGWDQPLPPLERTVEIGHRDIPAGHKEALRREEAEESLAPNALRALRELLQLPTVMRSVDVLAFAQEVGELFLVDGRLDLLVLLVRDVQKAFADSPAAQGAVRRFIGPKVLDRYIYDLPTGQEPYLIDLVSLVPGDHLQHVLDLLGDAGTEERRGLLTRVVARLTAADPAPVLERLAVAPPRLAASLLHVVATVAPAQLVPAALLVAGHDDPEVQLGVLRILAMARGSADLGHALETMLGSASSQVRVAAAGELSRRLGLHAFTPLAARLQSLVHAGIEASEAEAFGRILARASSGNALSSFREWIQPGALRRLARRIHTSRPDRLLELAAIAGLAEIGGADARALIQVLAASNDDELLPRCKAALARLEPSK